MVTISPSARAEIERLKLSKENLDIYFRLSIKSGGCLGFFYDLKLESDIDPDQLQTKGDRVLKVDGIYFAINEQSWQHVKELKLDYAEDLMGGGFRFCNPNISQTCGCGMSFAAIE